MKRKMFGNKADIFETEELPDTFQLPSFQRVIATEDFSESLLQQDQFEYSVQTNTDGDSEGDARDFEGIKDDLYCAINQFFDEVESLKELVIWGLCDAASAALFYAYQDRRVTGLVLLNPWIRTDEGIAKAHLELTSRDVDHNHPIGRAFPGITKRGVDGRCGCRR